MTQHVHEEDTLEDRAIMRRLAFVVAGFVGFTAVLALCVGVLMG